MTHERTERIRAFLDQMRSRITAERYADVVHNLREEEWQLAVLLLGEYLDEQDSKLNQTEWDTFSELARSVRLQPERFHWLRAESSSDEAR